jgi:hypothetical protein
MIATSCMISATNKARGGSFVRRSIAVAATMALISSGVVLSVSSPAAAAIGGTCSAWSETKAVDWQPDKRRIAARCSALNADTKARGYGVANGAPDHYTAWFTALNTTRYGAWGIVGIDKSQVQMQRV